jgi:hypothetical protein
MEAWVKSETTTGRYMTMVHDIARAAAAMRVVDKYHSKLVRVRTMRNRKEPAGMSTNDGINIPQSSLPTVGDTFV